MEKAILIALLEKYWRAETTVEEEQALVAYFREHEGQDEELQPYRDLFAYYGEEAQVTAGPDLGDRILQRLGIDVGWREHLGISSDSAPDGVRPIGSWGRGMFTAAAAILLVVASVFLMKPESERVISVSAQPGVVQDTYDDPQQALAAVRHALLIASVQLNKGRMEVTGSRK